ncbi:hypothetical protein EJB05_33319 [Eragrostis curvula]|uniref:C3H1-type domain-containing protein n=1 Tax=Eragrostis curvula TaxID=38414 RepID=A0A5J9U283_9POAL|nr:hypothetical protein EJB05_33319 [Eragrostis curvula]
MAAAAAADGGEDPRWRRSNTDCVSFLASRFACTKGAECEYRHCEGARFNFRSCWYWFQGNCVNPSCTFRHPVSNRSLAAVLNSTLPLESLNIAKSFADPLSSHGSACVKTASPCFFYYNSHCAKGDRCPFLHEPPTNNVVETCSEATTLNPTVNHSSTGDEMIQSLKTSLTNPAEDSSNHIKEPHYKGVIESSNPDIDGVGSIASERSVLTGGRMKSSTPSDQSSELSEMEHTEQDEWRDSSPDFDVIVDDRETNKNDLEHHQLAGERGANGPYVKYDGGDSVGYGLDYLDSDCYEQDFCGFDSVCNPVGSFYLDHFKEQNTMATSGPLPDNRINLAVSTFEDEYGRRFFGPRNFIGSMEDVAFHRQYTETEHGSKRRPENRKGAKGRNRRNKRRRGFEPSIGSEEIESRSTHGRLYSSMGDSSGPVVRSTFREQKKRSKRKQHHSHHAKSAERNANPKHQDCRADFTGPKTLAQIKEKCSSKLNSQPDACMPPGRSFSNDFKGPKSLSELLKAKSRTHGGK